MQPRKSDRQKRSLCPDLLDQLDPRNHLLGLAKVIPRQVFEDNFRQRYTASECPEKPGMFGLLILKQSENLSEERVVETGGLHPYFQTVCSQLRFTWELPGNSSELTYFHHRIGEDGARKIFEVSAAFHGDKAK